MIFRKKPAGKWVSDDLKRIERAVLNGELANQKSHRGVAGFMQSNLRKKLIQLFTEADGEFISGQKISEELGCSRTAVWKHIEDLRKSGYELEAVRKLGYKMIKKPDKITEDEIRLGLKTKKWDRPSIFRMSSHQLKKSPMS